MTDFLSRHGGRIALTAFGVVVLAFLIVPTLLVIPMSFSPTNFLKFPPTGFSTRWYDAYFSDSAWIDATLFSVQIAVLVTLASAIIGTMASIALVRGDVPGKGVLGAILLAPLIVPHVVVAIAVYFQFAPLGLVGTRLGFTLIHTALAVPYVVLVVTAALQRVPPSYEMAALNLGASRFASFRRITLPLIAPAIAAGAVFAFLASFDETVVSFFISGVEHKTVTRKLMEHRVQSVAADRGGVDDLRRGDGGVDVGGESGEGAGPVGMSSGVGRASSLAFAVPAPAGVPRPTQ